MEETKVTLNHSDIANIANDINNELLQKDKLSQGYLEWLICNAVRKTKNVNFFISDNNMAEQLMLTTGQFPSFNIKSKS